MHRHRWIVKEKTVMPSAFEQVKNTPRGFRGHAWDWFEKPVIVHYACSCGAEKVVRV